MNSIRNVTFLFYTLGLFGYFFPVVRPALFWPWEGSSYPFRSRNGPNGPKGPKFSQKVYFIVWTAETRSTIKVLFSLYLALDPESESESEPESESIRSPESESELESEQYHHDSAPLACTGWSGRITMV